MFEVFALTAKDKTIVTLRKKEDVFPSDLQWIKIDEGHGLNYEIPQQCYFPAGLVNEDGQFIYKYENGRVVERSAEEMAADYEETTPEPTEFDRLSAQVMWTALMTDTFLEG